MTQTNLLNRSFNQIIVIFPESPQTFTWGGSLRSLLFILRSFAFCMTKRLFPARRGELSEDKRKWNLPPAEKRPSIIRRGKSLHQN